MQALPFVVVSSHDSWAIAAGNEQLLQGIRPAAGTRIKQVHTGTQSCIIESWGHFFPAACTAADWLH